MKRVALQPLSILIIFWTIYYTTLFVLFIVCFFSLHISTPSFRWTVWRELLTILLLTNGQNDSINYKITFGDRFRVDLWLLRTTRTRNENERYANYIFLFKKINKFIPNMKKVSKGHLLPGLRMHTWHAVPFRLVVAFLLLFYCDARFS